MALRFPMSRLNKVDLPTLGRPTIETTGSILSLRFLDSTSNKGTHYSALNYTMLQSFYDNFGFFGALLLAFSLFIFFILWIAGIAGITLPYDGGRKKGSTWQIVLAILFPPYPVIWLIVDMYLQRRYMKEGE
jgi:hypothetical protein